jgi:putative transcriptional regulator
MAAGRGTHMEERPVLILADYGRVELTLRELMEQRGVSRNQLAKLINVRFEVVNKWFGGQVEKMDLDVLARICYALGCRVEDVLTYRPGEKQ